MTLRSHNESNLTYPNAYCIRVTGILQNKITDYFQGIEKIEVEENKDGKKESILVVWIRDQAELVGLVTLLYNWHHNMVSVHLEQASYY